MELKEIPNVFGDLVQSKNWSPSSRAIRPQVVIVSACLLVGISLGMSLGHSGVLLPQLNSRNSSLYVNEDIGSWIASVYAAAGPIGSLVGGISMEQWGRRKISFAGNAGMVIGWMLICGAQSASMLIAGRTIEGFARSMLAASLTVLIDELADPKFRGFTLCSVMTFASVGVMTIAGLGATLDWRTASGIAAAVSVISVFPFFFLSESPSWLVRKNRTKEAFKSLKWLWGPDKQIQAQEDLEFLKSRQIIGDYRNVAEDQNIYQKCSNFFTPRILKPFFILHTFNTFQAFCGFFIFTYYSIDILLKIEEVGNAESLNKNISAVLVTFVRVLGNIAITLSIIRIGRRSIALISGVGSSISALVLGLILLLQSTTDTFSSSEQVVAWVKLALITLFVGFNAFGFHMLPVLMLGETQAAHVRGFVCGYIYTVNDLVLGTVLKCYPLLLRNLEIHGLFLLFGISSLSCTIFVYLFLPETQGKTLEEIEDYFKQSNVMWTTRNKKLNRVS